MRASVYEGRPTLFVPRGWPDNPQSTEYLGKPYDDLEEFKAAAGWVGVSDEAIPIAAAFAARQAAEAAIVRLDTAAISSLP